jgi:hypothetical protein
MLKAEQFRRDGRSTSAQTQDRQSRTVYGELLAKVDWRGFVTDSGREQFHFGSPFRPND